MPDLTDFFPLYQETTATIRARINADVNAGLVASDPRWVDTREGSFFYDITQPILLEVARLWDALSVEVPAAAFVEYAWGIYLDNHAAVFNLLRKAAVKATGEVTFTGVNGTFVALGTRVSTLAPPGGEAVEFETIEAGTVAAGTALLDVRAVEVGAVGNVGPGAIVSLDTPVEGITAVSNALATTSGAEQESDEALRARIVLEFGGQGAGNINDYRRWALAIPAVGRVFVNPIGFGPGTVQVVIMEADGDPVSAATVNLLKADLDPVSGQGKGRAPVGINVTVQTPTAVVIPVVATVAFAPGFNLDGGGGLTATRVRITAALQDYINNLDVGGDVIYEHVKAQFFTVEGVLNISGVTVSGGTANVVITDNPPQVPQLGAVTLA